MSSRKVSVKVVGGIADILRAPNHVQVDIHDYDTEAEDKIRKQLDVLGGAESAYYRLGKYIGSLQEQLLHESRIALYLFTRWLRTNCPEYYTEDFRESAQYEEFTGIHQWAMCSSSSDDLGLHLVYDDYKDDLTFDTLYVDKQTEFALCFLADRQLICEKLLEMVSIYRAEKQEEAEEEK